MAAIRQLGHAVLDIHRLEHEPDGSVLPPAQVRAALDLSDGLSIDLFRLTQESSVGAEIRAEDLPVFPGATLDQAVDTALRNNPVLKAADSQVDAARAGVVKSRSGFLPKVTFSETWSKTDNPLMALGTYRKLTEGEE